MTAFLLFLLPVVRAGRGPKAMMGEVPFEKRGPGAWTNHALDPLVPLTSNGWTRLLTHAVADNTARQWMPKIRDFLAWAMRLHVRLFSCHSYDVAMAQYFDMLCYEKRLMPTQGSTIMFGFLCLVPEFSGRLFLAARSLKSWRKLATSSEGGPLCEEALFLIAIFLLANGCIQEGCWALIQYDAYAREQDIEQLAPADVLFDGKQVALEFGVASRGESVKTGANQGIVVKRAVVADILLALRSHALAAGMLKLFSISQSSFRLKWTWACRRLGLQHTGPPHSIRHAGPSEDLARGRAGLEQVRRRGRWRSMDSVQRYTKSFALTRYRSQMPQIAWDRGLEISKNLAKAISDALTAGKHKNHPLTKCILKAVAAKRCRDGAWQEPTQANDGTPLSDDEGWATD